VTRVLVVDDDPTVREVLAAYFDRAGMSVDLAADGEQALQLATAHPDLVVLDLMLPRIEGAEVFRRLRAERGDLPILMLTARGDEPDRLLGLEMGADDYVTKPFSAREIVLRVQSILRRTERTAPVERETLTDGDLRVDVAAHEASRAGADLGLTSRQLLADVWGWQFGDESTVTVHVRRLREKVEPNPTEPRLLTTVFGVGYRWDGDRR
jgi:DNA-binding response OmpR family regulator